MAPPQTQYVCRTSKDIRLVDASPKYEFVPGFQRPEGTHRTCKYSPCGRYLAYAALEHVVIVDPSTGRVVTTIFEKSVYELGFSPKGSFIITWQYPPANEPSSKNEPTENLKVFRVEDPTYNPEEPSTRQAVGQFKQRPQTGFNLQYTEDEQYCARAVTNEVHFFESSNLRKPWKKLRVEGVSHFALSPGAHPSIATFTPERKGTPASVKVFRFPSFDRPVNRKNFFKGDKVELIWNSTGTAVMVLAQTDVDKTNRSYYGETTMYMLGSTEGVDFRVPLDKEGPIHDTAWSPNGREFGVVYGYMPAKVTIFNLRGVVVHSFSPQPRNTIRFSPHGRFILVCGFGNLAGSVDIYDAEKKYKLIRAFQAPHPSICEWSPDGRYILMATTSPRLRVDNAVYIYHANGDMIHCEEFDELYGVEWRPQPISEFPLREKEEVKAPSPQPSAVAWIKAHGGPKEPTVAYRPPGTRGIPAAIPAGAPNSSSTAYMVGGPRAKRTVPGVTPKSQSVPGSSGGEEQLSKTAAKNKKKREAKKAKDGEAASSEQRQKNSDEDGGEKRSRSRASKPSGEEEKPAHASGSEDNGVEVTPAPTNGKSDSPIDPQQEKKIRGLLKKIRAIEELKMRIANGEDLEETQVKKISKEDSLRKELRSLGGSD